MALSVSGFPEPSRQLAASNEVFTGDSGQDGAGKTTLMNSPRLRGLFGASAVPSKKPDSKHSSATSKTEDTEILQLQGAITSSTPPNSTSSLSFAPSFEPLSQQEYELELQLPMSKSFDPPRTHPPKRPQLPPLPRKTTASPVRLGPSLTRLDIGALSRPPTILHPHSKPPPPSVVVEEWGPRGSDGSSSSSSSSAPQSRPLPCVPALAADSSKPAADKVAGPSVIAGPSAPLAGPSKIVNAVASSSKHVNAVAGPSKHSNAIAGPSKHPNALMNPTKPSPSSPLPPLSKVIIRQPIPQRTHKPSSPSVSMRYQPLVADPSSSSSAELSSDNNTLSSPVRPLPRIPPVAPADNNLLTTPDIPSRYTPPAAKIKRPKTSPGIIAGFPVGGISTTPSRSPFDNITRPSNTSAQRASSPPLPISSPMTSSRARSHSRPRRDRSLDSYYTVSRTAPSGIVVPSGIVPPITTNVSATRVPRSLPSPIVGARPLMKAATLDQLSSAAKLHIQTTSTSIFTEKNGTNRILSPGGGKRTQPPIPPAGPVRPRPKASSISTPTVTVPPAISVIIPAQPRPMLPMKVSSTANAISNMEAEIEMDERQSLDAPMHSHPLDAITDNESLLYHPTSPSSVESPVSVFMDDKDLSTMSRSPSPIRYARPDSSGELSDGLEVEEINFASSSSTSSSLNGSPTRRRRTQLRSYRNSYRPQARASPPHIPFRPPSPDPVHQHLQPPPAEPEKDKKAKKQKKTTRSYFGDYRASGGSISLGSGSAPATRASSPERKSRSRQPRKLTEAVSLALDEVRNRGRGRSVSPKSKPKAIAATAGIYAPLVSSPHVMDSMDVLDISRPIAFRRNTGGTSVTTDTATSSSVSDNAPGTSSTRSSVKVGWGKGMIKKRSDAGDVSTHPSIPGSSGTNGLESEAEAPFMWVSTSKPTPPASFMPPPPPPITHHHHRPMDSPGVEDYSPLRNQENISTSSASAARSPSSSVSSPFSAFSIGNRSSTKSKTKNSPSISTPGSATMMDDVLIIQHEPQVVDGGSLGEGGPATEVSTRRIMLTVNDDGDVWQHEQETDVANVIPHLRHLKAKRG